MVAKISLTQPVSNADRAEALAERAAAKAARADRYGRTLTEAEAAHAAKLWGYDGPTGDPVDEPDYTEADRIFEAQREARYERGVYGE